MCHKSLSELQHHDNFGSPTSYRFKYWQEFPNKEAYNSYCATHYLASTEPDQKTHPSSASSSLSHNPSSDENYSSNHFSYNQKEPSEDQSRNEEFKISIDDTSKSNVSKNREGMPTQIPDDNSKRTHAGTQTIPAEHKQNIHDRIHDRREKHKKDTNNTINHNTVNQKNTRNHRYNDTEKPKKEELEANMQNNNTDQPSFLIDIKKQVEEDIAFGVYCLLFIVFMLLLCLIRRDKTTTRSTFIKDS